VSGAPCTDRLIAALSARAAADPEGRWRVGSDETARLLGLDLVTFWREANDLRRRISFGDAIDGFTQDTVGDLVTLLERLVGPAAEEALVRAGLFLPYCLGIEVAESLQRDCRALAASHAVKHDDLDGMIRHAGSVRAAIGLYLEAFVDFEAVVASCAEEFRVREGLPPVGADTALRWLRHLVAKHVLDRRSLFTLLEERLRAAAARAGHVDPEDRERDRAGARGAGSAGAGHGPAGRHTARRAWALKVLGFAGGHGATAGEPGPDALRASYRKLMMRHHPDADPAGLERCKDVNMAYSFLIAEAR
jgi:hypothetical protein